MVLFVSMNLSLCTQLCRASKTFFTPGDVRINVKSIIYSLDTLGGGLNWV